jgi:hypothetical protein
MQKLFTTAHSLHTTDHHTINELAATNQTKWTALKKLNFTNPLILLEKKNLININGQSVK